jgi:hypothetical protein
MMMAVGSMDRMDSSKSNVKSKPLLQRGPAHGPKVPSTKAQVSVDIDAIAMVVSQQSDYLAVFRAFNERLMGSVCS